MIILLLISVIIIIITYTGACLPHTALHGETQPPQISNGGPSVEHLYDSGDGDGDRYTPVSDGERPN